MPIVLQLSRQRRRSLERKMVKTRDAELRDRYRIVCELALGLTGGQVAERVGRERSTVSRVARRFLQEDEPGLRDHRSDNGSLKMGMAAEKFILKFVAGSPRWYGWRRHTWTRELLCLTLKQELGLVVSVATMGRVLQRLGVRRKRPRPVVRCPWPREEREKRVAELRELIAHLPRDEIVFYEDEVDIHLNQKIGWDWMPPGVQKLVVTPGNNVKRYIAGALDANRGTIVWVTGERKASALFIELLDKLVHRYPRYRVIHLILDNYSIHHSKITQRAVENFGGRVVLHFLPPYDPNDNKIERLWQELHANTTRNHSCKSIHELMTEVTLTMNELSPYPGSKASLARLH